MFTKNIFKDKDTVADLVSNILESDYKVKKEELKGNQHKIDMNKNNKIDAHDFKLLRSKGTQKEEVSIGEGRLLVAKSELKKHKDWMDSEGYDSKTNPLPVDHPKHKTHVEVKPNSTIEHSYHLDGYAVKEEVESVAEGSDHDNDYHYTDEKGNKYRYGASGYVGVVNKNGINQGQQHISSLSDVHKKNYEKLYGKKTKNEEVEGVEEAYQKNFNPHDDLASRGIGRISMNKTPAGKKREFDRGTELLKLQMKTTKATGGVSGPKGKLPEEVESVAENVAGDVNSKERYHRLYPHVPLDMHTDHEYNNLSDRDLQAVKSHQHELAYKLGKPGAKEQSDIASHIQINRARSQYDQEQAHRRKVLDAEKIKRQARDAKRKQQGVAEEVEQIDELKKSTLMRYASKATKSAIGMGVKAARARDEDDMATWAKNRNKAERRDRNVQKAIAKMRSEEVEDMMEGSEQELVNRQVAYWDPVAKEKKNKEREALKAKKAEYEKTPAGKAEKYWSKKGVAEGLDEMDKTQTPPGRDGDIDWTKKQIHLGPERMMKAKDVAKHALKALDKTMKKSTPKKKGVAEEVEQVDERTLTPGETSEKERIVKGMKKSLSGFKQRYGDRAKSVMHATATKAAKKD